MSATIRTILYPVRDLAAAKELFTAFLGVAPSMDQPYYVGYDVEGQHIGLDPNGHAKGMTGPVGYRHVDDIEASLRALLDAGGEVRQEPKDVGGRLIASVADPDGNVIGLAQDL
ncbi:MAG: VOC family protein [Pseudonocardia sp.]